MTTATAFGLSLTETGHATDAPGWNLGFETTAKKTGNLTAVYWDPPADASGTVGWRIYAGSVASPGLRLGFGDLPSYVDAGGWQRFPITPIPVTLGDPLIPCVRSSSNGDYAFRSGVFPASSVGFDSVQGCFKAGSDAIPDQTSSLYFMFDVELTYVDVVTGTLVVTTLAATMTATGTSTASGTADLAATPATLTMSGTATATGTLSLTAAAAQLELDQADPPDADYTLGPPRGAWTIGQPTAAWTVGPPRG